MNNEWWIKQACCEIQPFEFARKNVSNLSGYFHIHGSSFVGIIFILPYMYWVPSKGICLKTSFIRQSPELRKYRYSPEACSIHLFIPSYIPLSFSDTQ